VGAAVDIEYLTSTSLRIPRSAAQLALEITELVANSELEVIIETSSDNVAWSVSTAKRFVEVGLWQIISGGLRRYVRARWSLLGSATVVTFGLAGEAQQLLCEPIDITTYAVPATSIAKVQLEDQYLACIAASDIAEAAIGGAFKPPLRAWGGAVRSQTAMLAAAIAFRKRGKDSQGPDASVFEGETRALSWFGQVKNGSLKPPGIIDSTPERYEAAGAVVARRPGRGWS